MSAKTSTNGQVRKTLADQIDRLDAMLDGLAEGLNDAVAGAVQDAVGSAVQQAVQAVLREALANPELMARLGAGAARRDRGPQGDVEAALARIRPAL